MASRLADILPEITTRLASLPPQETSTVVTSPTSSSDEYPEWILAAPRRRWQLTKERCREWVEDAVRKAFLTAVKTGNGWPLYFHGQQGRGKSTAALWFLDHVHRGVYATARELVDYEFCPDWTTKDDFRRLWREANLCVIDQFGMSGKQGPGQTQAVLDLIDKRDGRGLIIVSNLKPMELDGVYDAQIQSRVLGGTRVEFKGPDYRTKRPAQAATTA